MFGLEDCNFVYFIIHDFLFQLLLIAKMSLLFLQQAINFCSRLDPEMKNLTTLFTLKSCLYWLVLNFQFALIMNPLFYFVMVLFEIYLIIYLFLNFFEIILFFPFLNQIPIHLLIYESAELSDGGFHIFSCYFH